MVYVQLKAPPVEVESTHPFNKMHPGGGSIRYITVYPIFLAETKPFKDLKLYTRLWEESNPHPLFINSALSLSYITCRQMYLTPEPALLICNLNTMNG